MNRNEALSNKVSDVLFHKICLQTKIERLATNCIFNTIFVSLHMLFGKTIFRYRKRYVKTGFLVHGFPNVTSSVQVL